eukprot:GHUV01039636.1.p1 GENE.GHUV01039636.1~~GHUV01039636.1.p1  ORF type:complete len:149 (+),score=28.66 GHUV01039636.1:842-1288(+)
MIGRMSLMIMSSSSLGKRPARGYTGQCSGMVGSTAPTQACALPTARPDAATDETGTDRGEAEPTDQQLPNYFLLQAAQNEEPSTRDAFATTITCYFSCHEDLVDVLQECFVLHFRISEQEAYWLTLEASNLVQLLDVLKQIGDVVHLQ